MTVKKQMFQSKHTFNFYLEMQCFTFKILKNEKVLEFHNQGLINQICPYRKDHVPN